MRTEKEIRQRAPVWFIALLVLNFAVMLYDARDEETKQRVVRVWLQSAVAPFQVASSSVGGAGRGFFADVLNFRSAASENAELREQVATLGSQLREAEIAKIENERLTGLLGLREENNYETVMARVIARDPNAWFGTVTINRGGVAGIELNMPVVTAGGIVGRITTVAPWTSQVTLITDEHSGVGAVIGQLGSPSAVASNANTATAAGGTTPTPSPSPPPSSSSNAVGIINGFGTNSLLSMRYVSGVETVNVGDYVVTTGQDRIYPPGLSVGTVTEVKTDSSSAPHTILVRPSAPLGALQQVAVLRYRPPQRQPSEAPTEKLPSTRSR